MGGRDYITPKRFGKDYKWYKSGTNCQLGDYKLPPPKKQTALLSGFMKTHWFSLIRPAIKPLISWGGSFGGGVARIPMMNGRSVREEPSTLLGCPGQEVDGSMVIGSIFHLLINGVYWGLRPIY